MTHGRGNFLPNTHLVASVHPYNERPCPFPGFTDVVVRILAHPLWSTDDLLSEFCFLAGDLAAFFIQSVISRWVGIPFQIFGAFISYFCLVLEQMDQWCAWRQLIYFLYFFSMHWRTRFPVRFCFCWWALVLFQSPWQMDVGDDIC